MTSRERIRAALRHETTEQISFSLGFGVNEPVRRQMAPVLGLPDAQAVLFRLQALSDLKWVAPPYIGPADRNTVLPGGDAVDEWGVQRRAVSYGEGSYDEIVHYPLLDIEEEADLVDALFPDPDWYDYAAFADIVRAAKGSGQALMLGNANIFETAWYMRGLENMLMDLIAEPELAHALLGKVTNFYLAFMERCLEAAKGEIDLVFTADDIGQQTGLMLSLSHWMRFIQPRHRAVNELIHQYGAKVIYHTDGAVMEALPGLVDMGIDVLEALQFDAEGMDPVKMKTLYGDRLCFHGGISVQSTLPFGSPKDVEREVRERIEVLGKDGGYIVAPSHAIQAGTPVANVLAFFRAAGRPLR